MTKNERRVERLAELRRVLRNHDRALKRGAERVKIGKWNVEWDMGQWFSLDTEWVYDWALGRHVPATKTCDTACCALGSAACDPFFIKRGLKVEGNAVVLRDEYDSIMAGAEFFGITENESYWLFGPSSYDGERDIMPADVIERVNSLIKHYRDGKDDDTYLAFLAHSEDEYEEAAA